MNWIEVEWQSWHCANIDMDDIYASCERLMKERKATITQVVDDAIDEYVKGLDDENYYSWNEDAQKQVREVVLRHFGGEQISMFEE